MASNLNPYLSFRDTAKEAMAFYQGVLGGELTSSTFSEFGMEVGPDEADLVMHSQLVTDTGFVLMASDTPSSMDFTPGTNFAVSISGTDENELRGYWDGLTEGATVTMPLAKAPWGDSFGQFVDRFGVPWMINIGGTAEA